MSGGDDWQVGDLALCIARKASGLSTFVPGGVYTVSGAAFASYNGVVEAGLRFEGDPVGRSGGKWIRAIRFRKIRPLSDEERDNFLAELSEPRRVSVEA